MHNRGGVVANCLVYITNKRCLTYPPQKKSQTFSLHQLNLRRNELLLLKSALCMLLVHAFARVVALRAAAATTGLP
jgi:hypothetical protein